MESPIEEKLTVEQARETILAKLAEYEISWEEQENRLFAKDFRFTQKKLAEMTNSSGLKFAKIARDYFAEPKDIDIRKIQPYLVQVVDDVTSKIWSYAETFWSVPISVGYGRRLRFLVFDQQNDKLIGIFGLCDPLIGFKLRDEIIGWTREQKQKRLYSCMTAYILGAVPPYNKVLGSKLVALSTMFPEVRKAFHEKYKGITTVISKKRKIPQLAMIDTFGAFEKSAIYTRLDNWNFVGYTKGQSHIHITANGSWEIIKQFVPSEKFKSYQYGKGSNWKLRTLRIGLENLGFDENMLSIGWRRAYYFCPLMSNYREFLTMKTHKPKFIKHTTNDLIEYWQERWVIPRLESLKQKLFEI